MRNDKIKRYITLLLVASFFLFPFFLLVLHDLLKSSKAPVRGDAVGYYSYLPAVFTAQDLSFNFLIDENAPITNGENTFVRKFNPVEVEGMYRRRGDKYVNKYPIGVAILLSPFFLVGHVSSMMYGYETDGWNFFYQMSCFVGGLFYFFSGLFFLGKTLIRPFSVKVTAVTLFLIALGTSLFNYATFENLYSHVYSFFLVSLLLYIVPLWWKKKSPKYDLTLGVIAGLIVLVRNVNVVFLLYIFFYDVWSWETLWERLQTLCKKWKRATLVTVTAIVAFVPQMLYWKYATGSWLSYSYEGEGFSFLHPQFFNILFSIQKGLFFWSPVLLFAVTGFLINRQKIRNSVLGTVIILIMILWINASWWDWQFGWGLGQRAFVDTLPFFALGMAAFYEKLKGKINLIFIVISCILVLLSLFQTIQYWMDILPAVDTTWQDYKTIFLRLDPKLRNYWRED